MPLALLDSSNFDEAYSSRPLTPIRSHSPELRNTDVVQRIQDKFPYANCQGALIETVHGLPWVSSVVLAPEELFTSLDRIQFTWLAVSGHNPVLRTAILDGSLVQYDRAAPIYFEFNTERDSVPKHNAASPPYVVFSRWGSYGSCLTLHISQALVDDRSLALIRQDFRLFYHGRALVEHFPFRSYTEHLKRKEAESQLAALYWRNTFESVHLPTVSFVPLEPPKASQLFSLSLDFDADCYRMLVAVEKEQKISRASLLHAMWAIVWGCHSATGNGNVAFAVTGRDETFPEYQSVVGRAELTYPLLISLNEADTIIEFVRRIEGTRKQASEFAFYGYQNIVSELASTVMQSVLHCSAQEDGYTAAASAFPLALHASTTHSGLHLTIRYDRHGIATGKVRVLLEHCLAVLGRIVQDVHKTVGDIELLSPCEHRFLLGAGQAKSDSPVRDLLHQSFERQALATPGASAVEFGIAGNGVTYDELNRLANRVARKLPCGPGTYVPVCLERSVSFVVALLAVLKTGAAYVTLDSSHPLERNQFIVNDVRASVVIVNRKNINLFQQCVSMAIEDLERDDGNEDDSNLHVRTLNSSAAAYLIYTSGSTGKPKGVVLEHSAVCSGLASFPHMDSLRQLLFQNPVFSAAQRGLWTPLVSGGTLCLARKEDLTTRLTDTINKLRVTTVDLTPSTASLLDPDKVPTLRRVTAGGEPINPSLVSVFSNKLEFWNQYGVSECTQINYRQRLRAGDNPRILGRPSDTTSSYVLVPGTTKLSPLLVPGELCFGGSQLARCYLGNTEKTAESFIPNPFGPGKLYRTGDRVVAHENGDLELLGRIDFQIKINGQRVEPGEPNAIIQRHPDVASSSVVIANVEGRKAIVALVVLRGDVEWTDLVAELKAQLRKHLPSYMIPSYWLPRASLPLNGNGKMDVARLHREVEAMTGEQLLLSSRAKAPEDSDELWTEAEQLLRECWATVLHLSPTNISRQDSLLELGASSLEAIQLVSILRAHDIAVDVADVLRAESLSALAPLTHHGVANIDAPEPFSLLEKGMEVDRAGLDDAYPATPVQESTIADTINGSNKYLYQRIYNISGVDIARLRAAFTSVFNRDTVLRTTFVESGNGYVQVVRSDMTLPWKELDMDPEYYKSIDREEGVALQAPFFRIAILNGTLLVASVHHSLFDYWCSRFPFIDVAREYEGLGPIARPQFNRFLGYLQTLDSQQMKNFWKANLEGASQTRIHSGGNFELHRVHTKIGLEPKEFAVRNRLTTGTLVHAAWAIVLAKHTGDTDVTFATTISGRDVPVDRVHAMNGPTLTTVPFRVDVTPMTTLVDFAAYVQNKQWEMAPYSQYGMRKALQASGQRSSLLDTVINVLNKTQEETGFQAIFKPTGLEEPRFTEFITLEVEEFTNGIHISLLSDLENCRAEFILQQVTRVLESFVLHPEMTIESSNFIGFEESAFLKNISHETSPPEELIHGRFEKWAAESPDRPAVQFEHSEIISYGELNRRANCLGRYLANKGLKPDELIPLCLDKSIAMIVAILGVVKAGGAWVPLSPDNPPERNSFIAGEIGARFVLLQSEHLGMFEAKDGVEYITLDSLDLSDVPDVNFRVPGLTPSNLAYSIYTSGSTGLPKGCLVPHSVAAAANGSMIAAEGCDTTWRLLLFSNYVFDAAVMDIFNTFGCGGTLCMASSQALMQDLSGIINSMDVKQVFLTPSVVKLLNPPDVPNLEVLIVGGEPVTVDVVEKWASEVKLLNIYGPTETAMVVTSKQVSPGDSPRNIGKPFPTAATTILDPSGNSIVPYGAVGEICFSGCQVSRGYLNRPDMTSAAFFTDSQGRWSYRTGDLGRWLPGGEIECVGRKDNQVKINGLRMELGEIENSIMSTGKAYAVVVVVAKLQDKAHLVAICVLDPSEDERVLAPELFADRLTDISVSLTTLPHYMVPKLWLPMGSFPKLPSGKADRKRLLRMVEEMSALEISEYSFEGAQGEVEEVQSEREIFLKETWVSLFDVPAEQVGANSNFFALGGDSISAINLVSVCRHSGFTVTVADVLASPVLKDLALHFQDGTGDAKAISAPTFTYQPTDDIYRRLEQVNIQHEDIQDICPCVPGQAEFVRQAYDSEEQFWVLMTVRRLPEDLDFSTWRRATEELTRVNDILRAMYLSNGDQWIQVVLKNPPLDLEIIECAEEEKQHYIDNMWKTRFELGSPFVRYRLLVSPDGIRDLVIKLDHAMYDGTSLRVLDEQFTAIANNKPLPKITEFRDFAVHMNTGDDGRSLSYWKDQLSGQQFSRLAPPDLSGGPKVNQVHTFLTDRRVDAFAGQCQITVPIIFQTAFSLLLADLVGHDRITYDYLLTGRNVELEDPQMINGTCANFLPILAEINRTASVRELLKGVQKTFWEVTENGYVGLADIYGALGVDQRNQGSDALFLFQPFEPATGPVNHMRWIVMALSKCTMNQPYSVVLEVFKTPTGYRLKMSYDNRVFSEEKIVWMGAEILRRVDGMMGQSRGSVAELK